MVASFFVEPSQVPGEGAKSLSPPWRSGDIQGRMEEKKLVGRMDCRWPGALKSLWLQKSSCRGLDRGP